MILSINGEPFEFSNGTTLTQVLQRYNASEPFVVAVNTHFVPKPNYDNIDLNTGDQIDVVQPLQGG